MEEGYVLSLLNRKTLRLMQIQVSAEEVAQAMNDPAVAQGMLLQLSDEAERRGNEKL